MCSQKSVACREGRLLEEVNPFALITARHLGFDHAEPRPGAIFMRLVFCHGPPFSNPPSRASIRYNIHEVCLLSRPAIWDFCTQNLDWVQYL